MSPKIICSPAILVTGQQSGPGSTNTVRSITIPHQNDKPHYLNTPHTNKHLGLSDEEGGSCSEVEEGESFSDDKHVGVTVTFS